MKPFPPSMAQILRLTRAGNPASATRALQKMLGAGKAFTPSTPAKGIDFAALRTIRTPEQPDAAPQSTPSGGTVHERHYTGPAGSLGYRLYLPLDHRPDMPLVLMLHGCTQSPEDFARGTGMDRLADEMGFMVAYPRQLASANAQKCWNWFRPGDQRRDGGEPALIAGIVRQILADHRGDASRVYVAGLSAGGAAAAIMGDQYPDLFAAVGVHSGLACGAAHDLPSALAAMRNGNGRKTSAHRAHRLVPTSTFHGDRDSTVSPVNSADIIATASARADTPLTTRTEPAPAEAGPQPGGKGYTRLVSRDAAGKAVLEQWTIHGSGHAWSGGDAKGSYTDPAGPDASRAMLAFFLSHRLATPPPG